MPANVLSIIKTPQNVGEHSYEFKITFKMGDTDQNFEQSSYIGVASQKLNFL